MQPVYVIKGHLCMRTPTFIQRATPSFHGVPAFRLAWATGRTVSRVALIPIQVCGLSQLNHVEKDGPGPVQLAAASHVPPHLSFFFFFQKEIQKLPNSELEFDRKSHLGQNLFFFSLSCRFQLNLRPEVQGNIHGICQVESKVWYAHLAMTIDKHSLRAMVHESCL